MPTLPLTPPGPASPAEPQLSTSSPGGPKEHLAPQPPLQEKLKAPSCLGEGEDLHHQAHRPLVCVSVGMRVCDLP